MWLDFLHANFYWDVVACEKASSRGVFTMASDFMLTIRIIAPDSLINDSMHQVIGLSSCPWFAFRVLVSTGSRGMDVLISMLWLKST